jgi:hypothetical protein
MLCECEEVRFMVLIIKYERKRPRGRNKFRWKDNN